MRPRERVFRAIYHQQPDRLPRGELCIDPQLIRQALPDCGTGWQATRRFIELFQLDLVVVQLTPTRLHSDSLSQISRWHEETDLFVFALVGGGFSALWPYLGFLSVIVSAQQEPMTMGHWMRKMTEYHTRMALKAIEAGADGIIIGEDLAHSKGLFLPAGLLREVLFPQLAREVGEIKGQGVPVFFHSDGNFAEILPSLVELGFDGLQCLQASSGMDLRQIKEYYGDRLCLMGTIDTISLMRLHDRKEMEREIRENIQIGTAGHRGGYIFGTCSGLTPDIPLNILELIYEMALKYGK